MTALKKITFIERKKKEIAHSRKIKKLKSHIIISNKKTYKMQLLLFIFLTIFASHIML
jgi:hypothetical protein